MGGVNLYGFVDNRPISYFDSLGLKKDCSKLQIECFRRCWKRCPPWPIDKGSSGHYIYCESLCLGVYLACEAENEAEEIAKKIAEEARNLAEATREAAEWLGDHPEVVVGAVVVVAGVTFVAVTGGTGGLVLVAVGGLAAGS